MEDIESENVKLHHNVAVSEAQKCEILRRLENSNKKNDRNDITISSLKQTIIELQNEVTNAIINLQQNLVNDNNLNEEPVMNPVINAVIQNVPIPLLQDNAFTLGERLISLVNDANKYTIIQKGRKSLSITTGLLLQNLVSVCLCSMKKLPMIIATVLTMFFGKLDKDAEEKLIKSKRTYEFAITKSNLLLRKYTSSLFETNIETNFDNGIKNGCLILDASNKRNLALNTKPLIYLNELMNAVKKMQLKTDNSMSKKAELSGKATLDSMGIELSPIGMAKIDSAGCDKFGEKEVKKVLKGCDDIANNLYEAGIGHETFVHTGVNGVIYNTGVGSFRVNRVWTCLMHATENIFKPFLFILIQVRGLDKDAYIASNMFKVSYYNRKFLHIVNALNLISVGGNINNYDNINPLLKKIYTEIQNTRFTNQSRQSKALVSLLSVPANNTFIELVRQDYIDNDEEWNYVKKICSSFNQSENTLSHVMLQYLYISNHSPGGAKAEGFSNCMDLVAFMGSPITRINLLIVSYLYDFQITVARFADGYGRIRGIQIETISTRMIDSPVFLRWMLLYYYRLKSNWKLVLPDAAQFMLNESERAVQLGLSNSAIEFINTMEGRMLSGLQDMYIKAEKYLVKPFMQISFSVLLTLIPRLAAHWAKGLLKALVEEGHIDPLTEDEINSFKVTDPIHDNLYLTIEDYKWELNCDYCAFPNMTYSEFENQIYLSFTNSNNQRDTQAKRDKESNIDGILNGYGFIDPIMISNDIKNMATDCFFNRYLNGDLLDNWKVDTPVENFFHIYEEMFPNLAELMRNKFSYIVIATTTGEQAFTISTNLGHSNDTAITTDMKLNFALNVRGKLLDQMRADVKQQNCFELEMDNDNLLYYEDDFVEDEKDHNKNKSNLKQFLNNKTELLYYIDGVIDVTDKIYSDGDNIISSFRESFGIGKKKQTIVDNQHNILIELDQNKRGIHTRVNRSQLESTLHSFQDSYMNNLSKLVRPVEILTPLRIISNHKNWRAISIRRYIQQLDNNIIVNEIPFRRSGPYPEFRNCFDIVFELLEQLQPSQQYLDAILIELENSNALNSIESLDPILNLFLIFNNNNENVIDNNNNNNDSEIENEIDNNSFNSSEELD